MVDETRYGYETTTGDVMQVNGSAVKRISWAAVFAGVVLALVIQLVLNMLGTGIGLSTVDAVAGDSPSPAAFGISAGIWFAAASLIAYLIGGWVAGRLSGVARRTDATLHGLLTWGLSALLLVYLLASAAGSLLGGTFGLAGNVLSTAGKGIAAAAPQVAGAASDKLSELDISWSDIKQQAQTLLSQTGKPALQPDALTKQGQATADQAGQAIQNAAQDPQSGLQDFQNILDKVIRQTNGAASEADRTAAINVLTARGMSQAEAEKTIQNWQASYQQAQEKYQQLKQEAEQKARQAADVAAKAAAKASLLGALALLLGALVAALGGALSFSRRVVPL